MSKTAPGLVSRAYRPTFRPVRVPQRGDGLVVVVGGGADVGDHDRLAVAAQRVLQDPRQLRVPTQI